MKPVLFFWKLNLDFSKYNLKKWNTWLSYKRRLTSEVYLLINEGNCKMVMLLVPLVPRAFWRSGYLQAFGKNINIRLVS